MKHSMTDQNNSAAKASKKMDGALPSRGGGTTIRKTGKPGFPITNQNNGAPRASNSSDGLPLQTDHMEEAMSDGGNGPARGKSFGKKYATADLSQAIRRRKMGA